MCNENEELTLRTKEKPLRTTEKNKKIFIYYAISGTL